jgi:hypothetical protein
MNKEAEKYYEAMKRYYDSKRLSNDVEFKQEYLGEFIEPEPIEPRKIWAARPNILNQRRIGENDMHLVQLSEGMSKAPRSRLWKLEQELKQANGRCCIHSGQGERYFMYAMKRMRILEQIAKYRPLNKTEQYAVEQGHKIIDKYYSKPIRESNDSKILASALQKLDASPEQMPYNTIWTDMYPVIKRFGLTPEEGLALRTSKAWRKAHNGHEIDRDVLKLSSQRPDVPVLKKSKSLDRRESGPYFEEEEKPTCVACGGTGKSSTGRPYVPCQIRKQREAKRKPQDKK